MNINNYVLHFCTECSGNLCCFAQSEYFSVGISKMLRRGGAPST